MPDICKQHGPEKQINVVQKVHGLAEVRLHDLGPMLSSALILRPQIGLAKFHSRQYSIIDFPFPTKFVILDRESVVLGKRVVVRDGDAGRRLVKN